jgi:ubiquinone/menaquinone biosynthesis C-methylase UbiE
MFETPLDLLSNLRRVPDARRARSRYAEMAADYEANCRHIEPLRALAVERLALEPGETVIDVACGTGATTTTLARAVGPTGCVVGIEMSPQMAAIARGRLRQSGLTQARIVEAPVEDIALESRADALLFSFTHDVLQRPQAVLALARMAKPGARYALLGMRTLPWWRGWPINLFVMWRARRYLTTWHGLAEPWALLASVCRDIKVVGTWHAGTSYLAMGTFNLTGDSCEL